MTYIMMTPKRKRGARIMTMAPIKTARSIDKGVIIKRMSKDDKVVSLDKSS